MSSSLKTAIDNKAFNGLGFEPTEHEMEVFQKEKLDMYKGTFIVCLVYGICAIGLLLVIFYTEIGKEYIYKRMLPAAITFIIGAIFIIIFLSYSIYDLKPRKIRDIIDKDNNIVCPDYWVLKKVDKTLANKLITNNKNGKLFDNINGINDDKIKYKCEIDQNVYDTIDKHKTYRENMYKNNVNTYINGQKNSQTVSDKVDYTYVTKPSYTDEKLAKYAQFSGLYSNSNLSLSYDSTNSIKINDQLTAVNYIAKSPLICNVVYPQVLADLDKDTPEQNKYRCQYAKACDITWTDIGCKY